MSPTQERVLPFDSREEVDNSVVELYETTTENTPEERAPTVQPIRAYSPREGAMLKASDETTLELLADDNARKILTSTRKEFKSVSEMLSGLDMPTATAYRKVNALTDSGLLERDIQIRPHGNNINKYRLKVESVQIDLTHAPPAVYVFGRNWPPEEGRFSSTTSTP